MFDSLFPKEWTTLQRLMWLKTNALARVVYETISGNPVSFSARSAPLRQLKVAFSPVQDLNGYDSPWPAGGGKNKLNAVSDNVLSYSGYRNFTLADGVVTITGNTLMGFKVPVSASTNYAATFLKSISDTVNIRIRLYSGNPTSWDDASFISQVINSSVNVLQAKVTFTTTAETQYVLVAVYRSGAPSGTLTISNWMLELGTVVTDYAPYSNECPISGWDSLHVYDDPLYAGVIEWNQLVKNGNFASDTAWGTESGVTKSIADGVATISCSTTANKGILQTKFPVKKRHKYYISADIKHEGAISGLVGTTQTPNVRLNYSYTGSGDWERLGTITTANGNWTTSLYITGGSGGYTDLQVKNVMICDLTQMFGAGNEPATVEEFKALFPHDYYPYNAGTETLVGTVNGMDTRSISISLGSTVYSGTVDVVTGVVTVDKTTVPITADMIYNYNASRNAFAVYRTAVSNVWKMDGEVGSTYSFSHGIVVAKNNQFAGVTNGACCGSTVAGNQEFLFVKLADNFSDLDTAKAYVTAQANSGTPLQVCYYLATPQTIQLTPQEVQSLLGENVLFSDANGDLTVEYRSN